MSARIWLMLIFICGFAHAGQKIEVPVEVIDVVRDKPSGPRWETYRGVPHSKAVVMLSAAKDIGAVCHELPEDEIVVCYYRKTEPKSVGFDWDTLRGSLRENSIKM